MKDIVLDKQAFNFNRFSYRDETVIEHSAKNKTYMFLIIKKGLVKIKSETTTVSASTNEIAFIPSDAPYCIHFSPGSKGVSLEYLYWPDVEKIVFPIQKIPIDRILNEHIEALPEFDSIIDCHFIWESYKFLDTVQNYMTEHTAKDTKKIQKAITYMQENTAYSIPELARLCNMSESRFYVIFRNTVGMTPVEMKHKIQTEKAEVLLKSTGFSIEEIANKVGFESTAHFRKVFKNQFGCLPKEIRK